MRVGFCWRLTGLRACDLMTGEKESISPENTKNSIRCGRIRTFEDVLILFLYLVVRRRIDSARSWSVRSWPRIKIDRRMRTENASVHRLVSDKAALKCTLTAVYFFVRLRLRTIVRQLALFGNASQPDRYLQLA